MSPLHGFCKGDKQQVSNYWPVSLTCILHKILEKNAQKAIWPTKLHLKCKVLCMSNKQSSLKLLQDQWLQAQLV